MDSMMENTYREDFEGAKSIVLVVLYPLSSYRGTDPGFLWHPLSSYRGTYQSYLSVRPLTQSVSVS